MNEMKNEDQLTLITGTSRGIGKFLAEYYVNKGHKVIGCSRSESSISLDGYEHFATSVSDEKGVKNIFRVIRNKYGYIHNLINNAGIASMNHTLLTPISTVHKVMDTNIIGTFLFSVEAAKLMQKRNYGRIVNLSTVATPLKLEGEAIYSASKAAIVSLTQIMAREFAEWNITVNAVGPTPVETDLIKSVPKEKMDRLLERQAISRFGTFEDIVNVIDFYLRQASGFITGQNLYLGGV